MVFLRAALVLTFLLSVAAGSMAADPFPRLPPAVEEMAGPLPLMLRERLPVQLSTFTTNYFHAVSSQEANIALTARRMRGIIVEPGEVFSFNKTLGPYTEERGYGAGRTFFGDRIGTTTGGGVCQVASTLYNAVLLANLRVVERTPHSMTVPYLEPGRDATIFYGVYDFKFQNDTAEPIMIWATTADRHLTVSLYGRRRPPRVEIRTEILATWPPPVEIVADPTLAAGREEVITPGTRGVRSHTWLVVDGKPCRDLGVDEYLPLPRHIRRGTARSPV